MLSKTCVLIDVVLFCVTRVMPLCVVMAKLLTWFDEACRKGEEMSLDCGSSHRRAASPKNRKTPSSIFADFRGMFVCARSCSFMFFMDNLARSD